MASKHSKLCYDLLTFFAAKFSLAYLAVPFVLLELNSSLLVYNRMYFVGHLGCLFAIYLLPSVVRLYKESDRCVDKNNNKVYLKIY